LKNCQNILQNGCTVLYSSQQHLRVSVPSHLQQHLLLSVIFILAVLVCVRCYLVVSVCISLMTDDIEHLCMCLLTAYSLWRNVYSNLLPIMSWVVFLLLSCIFCIVAPHWIHDLQILCRLQWVVFSYSHSPLKHKVLDFDEVQFICFFFLVLFVLLVLYLTNHCLICGLEDLCLFGPKSFTVLALGILGVFSLVICGT